MARYNPFLRAALFSLAALVLLAGCGELGPPPRKNYAIYHTVRPGDTLYSVAWRYGYDYREVAGWNRIGPPYRIFPGQRLLVVPPGPGTPTADRPVATAQPKPRTAPSTPPPAASPTSPPPPASRTPQPARGTKSTPPVSLEKPAARPQQGSLQWQWPTTGKITRDFSHTTGKKGISIAGRVGQPVYAAAGGEVVYSGSGLVGYGNLLIIKHDDVFLSAYGHNRRLLVKEGEKVKPGQMIAEMGETNKDGALLHFEIRQEGKPVDPVRHLPKQHR